MPLRAAPTSQAPGGVRQSASMFPGFLGLLVFFLADCGADMALPCPNDLPASCPPGAPSYKTDIVPLIQLRCFPCHAPGGQAGRPLNSYGALFAQRGSVLDQVDNCIMPPPTAPALAATERAVLLVWLVCNAPNN